MEPRGCLGLSCLKKEQLSYELRIRGESGDGSVADLTAKLRSVLNCPLHLTAENIGEVGPTLSICTAAFSGVRENIDLLEGSNPTRTQVFRVQAQVNHWINRLQDLSQLEGTPEQRDTIQQLLSQAMQFQTRLSRLGWSDVEATEEMGSPVRSNFNDSGHGVVSEAPSRVAFETFARLPNPISYLFQNLSVMSVDELQQVIEILWLLVRLEKHADALSVSHQVILQLMYPLTRGILSRRVAEVLEVKGTLGDLRRKITRDRISPRIKSELVKKYFYRVQGHEETLQQYIEEIRIAVTALELPVTEEEAVENILEGIKPEDRSRLFFLPKPATFTELDELVFKIESRRVADASRSAEPTERECVGDGQSQGVRRSENLKVRRCFRCGDTAHLVRQCPVQRSERPNS